MPRRPLSEIEFLIARARHFRQLGSGILDDRARAALLAYAEEFQAKADIVLAKWQKSREAEAAHLAEQVPGDD